MSVLDALTRKEGFTKAEESLADYVLARPDEVAAMSIRDLAEASFTSNATIVRLCNKVGVDGFRDFRIQLAADLERTRVSRHDVSPDMPFFEGQSTREILSSVAALTKQAVDDTYAVVSPAEVRKAARLILGARLVGLYAVGDSEISCEAFANLMLKIGVPCFVADQHGDPIALSNSLGPRDVAVVVTYSGRQLQRLSRELRLIRELGCRIIAITSDSGVRERMAGLDCLILCPVGESNTEKIATYYAQSCVRYVLNSIYGECFAQNFQANVEHLSSYDESRMSALEEWGTVRS